MKTRPGLFKLAAIAAAVLGLAFIAQPAQAQSVTYTQGDLLLGFRDLDIDGAGPDTANTFDVVINIGQASLYRDATSSFSLDVGNLGTILSDTYGSTWYDDPGLRWSVIGSPANSGDTFNGDPANTFYVSKEQTTFGTPSTAYTVSDTNRALVATRINTVQTLFDGQTAAAGNNFATIWNNTLVGGAEGDWTDAMIGTGRGNLAFGVFTSSQIQGGDATGLDAPGNALDLWRYLQLGNGGTLDATREGTFTIDDTGAITFTSVGVVPEPSRALLLAFGLALPLLRRRRASVTGAPAIA